MVTDGGRRVVLCDLDPWLQTGPLDSVRWSLVSMILTSVAGRIACLKFRVSGVADGVEEVGEQ